MPKNPTLNNLSLTIILFLALLWGFSFAEEKEPLVERRQASQGSKSVSAADEESSSEVSTFKKEARIYRAEGLKSQEEGDLDKAMSLYQKAVEIDPSYALAFNDLGIMYEAKGIPDYAQDCYLRALKLDPSLLSTYSNLALFYEGQHDLEKAVYFWQKRVDLGLPEDPWTQKAKKRIKDLAEVMPDLKQRILETEVMNLSKDIEQKKWLKKEQDIKEAKGHLEKAKRLYDSGEYKKSIDELSAVLSLDSNSKEALDLLDKAKQRVIEEEKEEKRLAREREKKENISKMQEYFKQGIGLYQQDNPVAAKQVFDRLEELAAAPQKD